jgi:hypothetical protein
MTTITKAFSEMYGNNEKLNYKRMNVSANNMLKNIVPNQEYTNNNGGKPIPNNEIINKSISNEGAIPYGIILFVLVMISIIGVIYIYREKVYALFEKLNLIGEDTKEDDATEDDTKEDHISQVEQKLNDHIKKYDTEAHEKNIKEKEIEEKNKNINVKKGAVNELSAKVDTISNYKQEQLVKENSFCYIGYESGQRECTNVFDGDVCMSGEIFPKLDICINPHLRV